MKTEDFFWLVGLLEGEGSFIAGSDRKPRRLMISCNMTDEDVIARVARLFDGRYYRCRPRKPHHKQSWTAHICGAKAQVLMKRLLPHMGERRQQAMRHALAKRAAHVRRPQKILSVDLPVIRKRLLAGETQKKIAADYGVDRSYIGHIAIGDQE